MIGFASRNAPSGYKVVTGLEEVGVETGRLDKRGM